MFFHKSFEGIVFDKCSLISVEDLQVGLNGYILIHKELNCMAFTNNREQSNLYFEDKEKDYKDLFSNSSHFEIKVIKKGKLINSPTKDDIQFIEDNKYFVRYSKITKLLKDKGYSKTKDVFEVGKY